jgi:hypothetical protein
VSRHEWAAAAAAAAGVTPDIVPVGLELRRAGRLDDVKAETAATIAVKRRAAIILALLGSRRWKEVVHWKNLRLAEREAAFFHCLLEQGRKRIVGCSRIPDRHCEERIALTNARVKDQASGRRDWGPAYPALAILVGCDSWRPVDNSNGHS